MTEPNAADLAEALVVARRWDSALTSIASGLARDPADPRLSALLVRTLRALGRRAESVEAAQRLLALTPQDPYALRLATLVLLDVGSVDEAIGVAERAVAIDPSNPANHLALSRAWGQSRRAVAIRRQYAAALEAVKLNPNSVDAHIQVGAALAAGAEVQEAREAYLTALRLDPHSSAALNNLAVLEVRAGALAAAARYLAAALATDPNDAVARRNLDALAVRLVARGGWWMLAVPLAALLAASRDLPELARVVALVAVLGVPVLGARWWRSLTVGQRQHLRTLRGRTTPATWAWPLAAAVVGTLAVAIVLLAAPSVDPWLVRGYAVVAGVLAAGRLAVAISRRSWDSEVMARAERLQHLGRRSSGPPPEQRRYPPAPG